MRMLTKHTDKVVKVMEAERRVVNSVEVMLMVMEMGHTCVKNYIESRRAELTQEDVKQCWSGMVACVASIHQHNILHLDIKPDNFIFVGNQIKLIDFGSSVQITGVSIIDNTSLMLGSFRRKWQCCCGQCSWNPGIPAARVL